MKTRVLQIEDDPFWAADMAQRLAARGFEVDSALTSLAARQRIQANGAQYDVILCDLFLERKDDGKPQSSLELVRELKETATLPPVILCTSHIDAELKRQAGEVGITGVVTKNPDDIETLIAAIYAITNPKGVL